MKVHALIGVGLLCGASARADLAEFVNPFVGTDATGHTFPAACCPLGLVQAGPDTGNAGWEHCSGYVWAKDAISGFSQTHLNGTGCPDLGDVRLLPFVGDRIVESLPFRHADEVAAPGFYSVKMDGGRVSAEVAAAEHSAIYRFAYSGDGRRRLLVDPLWGMGGDPAERVLGGEVSVTGRTGVVGQVHAKRWVERRYAFTITFSRPFASVEELPRGPGERLSRFAFDFDLKPDETLTVKVALSCGTPDAARRNLVAEIPGWDFDAVKDAARQKWNAVLGKAVAEGTDEQKRNWYTSLYHLYIQPNNVADAGGKPFYSTFSCWDTFRAAGPLYTILSPDKAAEFVDSMLEQGKKTGYLPIWTLWGEENQCMIGTHSVPMIVDWFLKEGVVGSRSCTKDGKNSIVGLGPTTTTNYWESAYAQIKETLAKKHDGRVKENWDLYDQYGYYPFDKIRGESVSRTLECAYDDWCAAQMAKKLGKEDDYAFFMKRASNWKNVFDPSVGLVRGKDSKGSWREPFEPFALGHGADVANDFTEGNSYQYTWHVMQDPAGLIAASGGKEEFVRRLERLFTLPSKVEGAGFVSDVSGLIGQYAHGNEPSHHVVYFFTLAGRPDLTAKYIRRVFDEFYLPKPDGLCGNDDCGQMSAWYLFSAMGFYPFNPCGDEYVLGAPQVPKAQVKVKGEGEQWNLFTVVARGLSKENKYVKSVTLNGKPITDWKIRHADIMAGGELVFEMGAK